MNTPTPWQEIDGEIWNDDATKIIASNLVHPFAESGPVRLANAAFIVKCVNSHASLVEALEAAMEELEANKVAMIGPEWASQRTMTGGALAKCARALRNAKAQA